MKTEVSHIERFMDGVDTVLNSNTLLLTLNVRCGPIERLEKQIRQFIDSGAFKAQLLQQDKTRRWNNYSRVKDEQLIKLNYMLQLQLIPEVEVEIYFSLMLSVDRNPYNFWSPYSTQFEKPKSIALTKYFLSELSQNQQISVYRLNTNFSYTQVEAYRKKKRMAYFEGDYGSDSATIIVRGDGHASLILTNGRD